MAKNFCNRSSQWKQHPVQKSISGHQLASDRVTDNTQTIERRVVDFQTQIKTSWNQNCYHDHNKL